MLCRPPSSLTPHRVRSEFTLRDLELLNLSVSEADY